MVLLARIAGYSLKPDVWVDNEPATTDRPGRTQNAMETIYQASLPSGLPVLVLRGGLFGFDFSTWSPGQIETIPRTPNGKYLDGQIATREFIKTKLNRIMLCNAHLACLYAALTSQQSFSTENMIVSPEDLIPFYAADIQRVLQLQDISGSRPIISLDTVRESYRLLEILMCHNPQHLLTLADLYARSLNAITAHNYNLGLVLAWTLTEKLLHSLWSKYISDNEVRRINGTDVPFINKERKKRLEGNAYTASAIIEILSLTDILPFNLYQHLTVIRKARNDWIHELRSPTVEKAKSAVYLAAKMLSLVENVDLRVSISTRISGP